MFVDSHCHLDFPELYPRIDEVLTRMREKGVANSRSGARGDQIVEIAVEAPVVQDERTKELLREYAELHPEDPRAEIWEKV